MARWLWVVMVVACAAPQQAQHAHGGDHHGNAWDRTYARGTGFRLEPNALLQQTAASLPPGVALDVGMGQGRNALHLASLGWKVTGVDPSVEGNRIAREAAAAKGLTLDAVVGGIEDFDLGRERYDLVALIYVGGADLAERIIAALKPGGVVVVEFFHRDMEASLGHHMGAFETHELERLFPGFEVLRSETVEDVADFGLQRSKLVRFVGRKPR